MAAEVEAQARAELDGISLAGFGGVMFSPPTRLRQRGGARAGCRQPPNAPQSAQLTEHGSCAMTTTFQANALQASFMSLPRHT
jgi:hypothetical protein